MSDMDNVTGNVFDDELTAEEQVYAEETGADMEKEAPATEMDDEEAELHNFRQQREIAQMLCEIYNAVHGLPARKQSKDITIRKQNLPIPYVYEGQQYALASIEAVAQLVKIKGSQERTVIIYSEEGVKVVLDDTVQHRTQDTARFSFEYSDEWNEWRWFVSNNQISQKDFVDFLRKRDMYEVTGGDELIAKIQNLKIATEIVGDFTYDDNNNVSVMIKIRDKEQAVKLPREIEVWFPLVRNTGNRFNLKFDLELFKPKAENEKPYFTLTCNNFDKNYRRAVEAEIKKLKDMLPEHLILAGKF